MRRLLWIALTVVCCCSPAFGCGDKFLIIGRGASYRQRYVAIHPARILLFTSKAAGDAGVDVRRVLQRAGHKVDYAPDEPALDAALRATPYDIVITPIGIIQSGETRVHSIAPQTLVVPIIFASNEREVREAEKKYECIAKSSEKERSFLAILDDAMAQRLRGNPMYCKWSAQ
jgi:hypothetical protein